MNLRKKLLKTFSGLRSLSLQGRLYVSFSLIRITFVLEVLPCLHGDVILETLVTVSGDADHVMLTICLISV
jgi:isopentenyl phosphate kinase